MRILVTTPYFFPHTGGSQNYIANLYQEVRRIDPSIHVDVVCYNTEKSPQFEHYKGLNVYRVPCIEILRGQFALPNYFALLRQLYILKKQFNTYDIVNAHTRFFDNAWWSPIAARYLGAKSVLTDHCAATPTHENKIVKKIVTLLDNTIIPFFAKQYDVVTAVSKATAIFLSQKKITVHSIIYGGVHTTNFANEKKFSKTITVTFLGRMIPTKGPQLLAEISAEIHRNYPEVQFLFAGEGELYRKLKEKYESDFTHFLGDLNQSEVISLLQKTDILVHPSHHHEGFPIVLIEAGAANCAVIATKQGGVSELIINGKTGSLIEADDTPALKKALEDMINHPSQRRKLAQQLLLKVQKEYDWKHIANKFLHTLKQITA